jgi:hypothetical protein
MSEAGDEARTARTALERLGARIPGFAGYLERELRREMDQLLRRHLAARLDSARSSVNSYLRGLPLTAAAAVQRLGTIERALDAIANVVRHAGTGYAGLFDAAKVREAELEALYRFDVNLTEEIESVAALTAGLAGGLAALEQLEQAVSVLRAEVAKRDGVLAAAFVNPQQERASRV